VRRPMSPEISLSACAMFLSVYVVYTLARELFLLPVKFGSMRVLRGLLPYWRLLPPDIFIAMLGLWLWALRFEVPSGLKLESRAVGAGPVRATGNSCFKTE
jgi:hypothetical protein